MFHSRIILPPVSIHALTRSATALSRKRRQLSRGFNPRTHEECDYFYLSNSIYGDKFQSTHSRGVRQCFSCGRKHVSGFNPRTHEECDNLKFSIRYYKGVSIHALTRSATTDNRNTMRVGLFQSTHSRGVRHQCNVFQEAVEVVSIHALTRSATAMDLIYQAT